MICYPTTSQPQLQPALLRLSAMISQYFTVQLFQSCVCINEDVPVALVRLRFDKF